MASRTFLPRLVALSLFLVACTSGATSIVSENGDSGGTSSTSSTSTPQDTVPLDGSGVIFDGSTGADEASDAVRGLLGAINSGDVLGALSYIDPAERDLLADLYLTALEGSSAAWPQFGGDEAISALGVEVLPLSQLRTTVYNDHLAWVETDEVEFYMSAPTEVAASFFSDQEPWGPGSGYTREEIAHREDDWSEFVTIFGDSSDVLPGLMVTELDGRWYVSFGRTILELVRVDAEFAIEFPPERELVATTPADSPELAVFDFLDALSDDRFTDAGGHLVATEGQTFADYPGMLDRWLPGLFDFDIELDPSALRVVDEDSGRAVVEITEFGLDVTSQAFYGGEFEDRIDLDYRLQLADRCLLGDYDALWCEPIDDAKTAITSVFHDLGWEGVRLVTVESDDGWSVSLYESIAQYGLPFLSEPLYGLAYSQFNFPIFGDPLRYTLVNETAKNLPLQTTDTITLEPHARNRILIARLETATDGRVLYIEPSALDGECSIAAWNTDMVTDDWNEEPEFYDDSYCDYHLERPLEIPAGVEMTLLLVGSGEQLEPLKVELR